MTAFRLIAAATFLVSGSVASSQWDPWAETDFSVRQDGDQLRLIVSVDRGDPDGWSFHARHFDANLAPIAETELSEAEYYKELSSHPDGRTATFHVGTWFILGERAQHRPALKAYRASGKIDLIQPRWPRSVGHCAGFAVTRNLIVVACNEHGSPEDDPFFHGQVGEGGRLQLYGFDAGTLESAGSVSLGDPSRIDRFPCCTRPVIHGGIAYIGWARRVAKQDGAKSHEIVISEWEVEGGDLKHHVVDKEVSWNTSLSICAFNDRIVLAYQGQTDKDAETKIELRSIFKDRRESDQDNAPKPASAPKSKYEGE